MAVGSDGIDWAPYRNRGEAAFVLCQLINRLLDPDIGILWYCYGNDKGSAIVLRKARPNKFGFGHSVIFRWHPVHHGPLPPPDPPKETVSAVKFFTDFLTDSDNEHAISFGFDVLAIIATTAIAIPAGAAVGTAGAIVTAAALIGAFLCAMIDGAYLTLRHLLGGSVEEKSASSTAWDHDPLIGNLSILGVALTLPDFFMHSAATAKDIGKAVRELRARPGALKGEVLAQQARARRLGTAAAGFESRAEELTAQSERVSALSASRLADSAKMLGDRAKRIAAAAKDAHDRSVYLQDKLHAKIIHEMATGTGAFVAEKAGLVGTPTSVGYSIHDNMDKISWVQANLLPFLAGGFGGFGGLPGTFVFNVATSHTSQT